MFALVDCNNFYASCERVFRPDLRGKPIAILSNNDGCVIARSNEAKAVGVPMGAPAFKYEQFFKENGVAVFSSNYPLYGDMSHRVMRMLHSYTPEMEVYSIDEAFLKFSNCDYIDIPSYGVAIQKNVTKSTGIPISVGFAPTKALAKVANKIAKKYPNKTHNVYVIDTEEKHLKALRWLKIEDVWGIGRRHAKRLQAIGITTAYEFTQQSDEWVRKQMSVVGLRLKHDLEGKPTLDLEQAPTAKKNILVSRSFDRNYTNFKEVQERVTTFMVTCSEKLRAQQTQCKALYVFLQTNRHRQDLPQNSIGKHIKLPYATNSAMELSHFVNQALKSVFKEGYHYKKAGVIALDLVPEDQQQISLFENTNPKHKPLLAVVDKLNQQFGQHKIKTALQDPARTWKMKQERLSPRYTTQLKEIIKVNCNA